MRERKEQEVMVSVRHLYRRRNERQKPVPSVPANHLMLSVSAIQTFYLAFSEEPLTWKGGGEFPVDFKGWLLFLT